MGMIVEQEIEEDNYTFENLDYNTWMNEKAKEQDTQT